MREVVTASRFRRIGGGSGGEGCASSHKSRQVCANANPCRARGVCGEVAHTILFTHEPDLIIRVCSARANGCDPQLRTLAGWSKEVAARVSTLVFGACSDNAKAPQWGCPIRSRGACVVRQRKPRPASLALAQSGTRDECQKQKPQRPACAKRKVTPTPACLR